MKLLPIALPGALAYLCSTYAAYLAVDDQLKPWTGFQEGLLMLPSHNEHDSHHLCDVMIGNDKFQVDVHSTSSDEWVVSPRDERNLPQEYVTLINQHLKANAPTSTSNHVHSSPLAQSTSKYAPPIITCQRPAAQVPCSILQRRIGFMHVIDLLSIVAVGLFAAIATCIAAVLRRNDQTTRSVTMANTPRLVRLDQLRERPSPFNLEETEYVFDYIKCKLG